jgi:DNA-binding transcriptional LysR family regulator
MKNAGLRAKAGTGEAALTEKVITMQTSDVRIFLATAAAANLSAAARQLGLGPMQVSRRLAALEEELGVRLFHRTTRSVSLTPEGDAFLPFAQTMAEAEESARSQLSPSAAAVSGVLRMTAPSVFGQAIVLPLVARLMEAHPALRVDLDLSDRVQDIVGGGLDLALRVAHLADSELVARKMAPNPWIICAAPAYLARHGRPRTLAQLDEHDCIVLQAVPKWPLIVRGVLQRRRMQGRVATSSVDAARTAALLGMGVSMLTYWDVHQQLADGTLVQVELEDASMAEMSVWAVMPTRRHVPTRVKVFLDALERELVRPR